jgi:hypothetical protein
MLLPGLAPLNGRLQRYSQIAKAGNGGPNLDVVDPGLPRSCSFASPFPMKSAEATRGHAGD